MNVSVNCFELVIVRDRQIGKFADKSLKSDSLKKQSSFLTPVAQLKTVQLLWETSKKFFLIRCSQFWWAGKSKTAIKSNSAQILNSFRFVTRESSSVNKF